MFSLFWISAITNVEDNPGKLFFNSSEILKISVSSWSNKKSHCGLNLAICRQSSEPIEPAAPVTRILFP